uniref:Uncharacterized protein n=1 Tax=Glossina palpalis gambiensis TaxID=67801 RepID=A0A1B0C3N2_9MUSC
MLLCLKTAQISATYPPKARMFSSLFNSSQLEEHIRQEVEPLEEISVGARARLREESKERCSRKKRLSSAALTKGGMNFEKAPRRIIETYGVSKSARPQIGCNCDRL